MQVEELHIPSEDREEATNTGISPSREAVVNKTPSRGMRQLHKSDNSDSDEELALQKKVCSLKCVFTVNTYFMALYE